jgi:biopolymer transport protein ExbD
LPGEIFYTQNRWCRNQQSIISNQSSKIIFLMNFRKRTREAAHIEAGALSDILFFLMLFFLIVSTLASPSAIKLLLPKASTGKTVSKQPVQVSITADLKYYLNKTQVTLPELEAQLTKEARRTEKPTVVLRIDKSVTVEELVKVADIMGRLKIGVTLATDRK